MDFDLPPDSVNYSWHKAEGTNDMEGGKSKSKVSMTAIPE